VHSFNKPKSVETVELVEPIQPTEEPKAVLPVKRKLSKPLRITLWSLAGLLSVIMGVLISSWLWYSLQLTSASNIEQASTLEVKLGSTPKSIGDLLEENNIIRSSFAFQVYVYLSNSRGNLQAGSYQFSPLQSTEQIVKKLVDGDVLKLSVTFLPGATLAQNRQVLVDLKVFTEADIDDALGANYESPLLESKPANADLEGYIYGETYDFNIGVSVSNILKYTFDQFYSDIETGGLETKFTTQGLNLRQAIILASIIQKEVSGAEDQKQVAQVFLKRFNEGIQLGSDVTYQYIADKLGVPRDINLDNPYNTRRYTGMPPGPISSPGLTALQAVAEPAEGDYLYFLSGDDGKTYFARTADEHQQNITNNCQIKCFTP